MNATKMKMSLKELATRNYNVIDVATVKMHGMNYPLSFGTLGVEGDRVWAAYKEYIDWSPYIEGTSGKRGNLSPRPLLSRAEWERGLHVASGGKITPAELRRNGQPPSETLRFGWELLKTMADGDLLVVTHSPWPGLKTLLDAFERWLGEPTPRVEVVSTGLLEKARKARSGQVSEGAISNFIVSPDTAPEDVPSLEACWEASPAKRGVIGRLMRPEDPLFEVKVTHLLWEYHLHLAVSSGGN